MISAKTSRSERQLLDTLERMGSEVSDVFCLYMKFSELKYENKQQKQVRLFKRLLGDVLTYSSAELFILSNKDFVILGNGLFYTEFESVIKTIKNMLRHDPFIANDSDGDFAKVYDFPDHYQFIYELVKNFYEASDNDLIVKTNNLREIEAEDLDNIITKLSSIAVEKFVRKQSAVVIHETTQDMKVVFQEYFTSMKELSKELSPNIDILGDRWLFQHLTQTLDKRMLTAFANLKDFVNPPQLNLNLNLSSVFSKEFVAFAKGFLTKGQKITVEFQLMDVFHNLNLFYEARELLWKGGHKVLLDSVDGITLDFLDVSKLKVDYIKLLWNPGLVSKTYNRTIDRVVDEIGKEKIILIRCETEAALRWGMRRNINTFQGYYIDSMLGAMTKAKCPFGKNCTIEQCSARKGYLLDGRREECFSLDNLDDISTLKSGA